MNVANVELLDRKVDYKPEVTIIILKYSQFSGPCDFDENGNHEDDNKPENKLEKFDTEWKIMKHRNSWTVQCKWAENWRKLWNASVNFKPAAFCELILFPRWLILKLVSTTVQTTELGKDDEDDTDGEDDEKTKVDNIQTIWSS